MDGAIGLYQMPTAFIASAGGGGLSLYMYKDDRTASGAKTGGPDGDTFNYSNSISTDARSIGFAYSFNENIELSGAQIQMDVTQSSDVTDYFQSSQSASTDDIKTTVLGVKFNPRKKYLLQPGTHKQFEYAFGVQNFSSSGEGEDMTRYYGVIAMPGSELTFHGMVYYASGSGLGSQKWGSMAGIEAPVMNNAMFMADMDQFAGVETYILGLRYLMSDKAALTVAVHDITDTRNTMLSGSFNF